MTNQEIAKTENQNFAVAHIEQSGTLEKNEPEHSRFNIDEEKFQVILDISYFRPEDIKVITVSNKIEIIGRYHDIEGDERTSLGFHKTYTVPHDCDMTQMKSIFANGYLTVTVPRLNIKNNKEREVKVDVKNTASFICRNREKLGKKLKLLKNKKSEIK